MTPGDALSILRELVDLKDGPRDADYERRKPLAWEAARRLVRQMPPIIASDAMPDGELMIVSVITDERGEQRVDVGRITGLGE
jgi:hypothetical protein